jgi:membrane protein DedA with SNARE-associated domain
MLDHLNDLILRLEHWGYVVVFLIVLLECQAFLGFFMPGESMVMVAGFLAGQDLLDVRVLIPVVAVAAIMGDSIGYEFGRRLGRDWLRRHGEKFWLRPEQLDRLDAFFVRYGGLSVLFAHFLHVGRALMPFLAGASRLPYLRFLICNSIGCILWAAIFSLLGYLFGQSWHLIEHWVGRAGVIAAILVAMVVITLWVWRGITSRELEIREWGRQFWARTAVQNLRRRFARPIDWLAQRFSPEGYLGLHLTVGGVLLLAAVAIFGGLSRQIGTRDWLVKADSRIAEWFANHSGGAMTLAMNFTAYLGSIYWLAALLLIGALFGRRNRHYLQLVLVAGPGGVLLDLILKRIFDQERSHFGYGSSFGLADGDLLGATIVYGVFAYILMRSLQSWHWRALILMGTILLVFLLALCSLYLGGTQLSEAVAAVLEGAFWLSFSISGVEIVRWRKVAHRATSLP